MLCWAKRSDMPRFAVVIPVYNKAPYVARALTSVLRQSFADWELVVVDDGSIDGSTEVIARYTDSRMRVVRQDNAGVASARNRGVAQTSAPFVAFLDADDWWEPTFLQEMDALIRRHPGAGLYSSRYWIVRRGQRSVAALNVERDFEEGEVDYFGLYAQTLCMPLCTGSVCVPREVFDKAGGFRPGVRLGEDFLLWAGIALENKTVVINKPLLSYNQDVDVAFRGTHHLYPPEEHFLWHLGDLEERGKGCASLRQLLDNMRTYNLMSYLLEPHYCAAARKELEKVDWARQPRDIQRLYRLPVPLLRLRKMILAQGAAIKQRFK